MALVSTELVRVVTLLHTAAIDGDWAPALNAFADACGADHGQLIGIGADRAVPFNWISGDSPPVAGEEFVELGGGDPLVNPRVRVGLQAPLLKAWHDLDCFAPEQQAATPVFCEFCIRYDLPYGSQATLMRDREILIGTSTLRGARQGLPSKAHRHAFEFLTPHLRDAVRMQMNLAGRGAELIAGALERVGAAAFVIDGGGYVRALTTAAEAALSVGPLHMVHRRLSAARGEGTHALEAAIAASLVQPAPDRPPVRSLVLHQEKDLLSPLFIDVMPLPPQPYAFGFEPRVVAVLRGTQARDSALSADLQAAFRLTAAEAEIAVRLADGDLREEIAADRAVTVATVRSQIKTLFQKMGVNRALQMAVKVNRLR